MKNKVSLKIAMLSAAVFLLVILFPAKVFAENEYTVTEMTAEGEVISDVNVRSGPATSYDIIGTVRAKDMIAISGKSSDGWYRIDFEGQTGFVYGEYISVMEPASTPEPEPEQQARPHESGTKKDFGPFRLAAIFVIIIVIVIMIILTIRSFIQGSRDEEDDEEEEEEEDGEDGMDEGADEVTAADEKEDEEKPEQKENKKSGEASETVKTIVIREEDYQLHIDPKYFEDEPLTQPEYVTDYLKKLENEDTQPVKPVTKKENADDLTRAMKKLEELQEEIERLKRKQQ